MCVAGARWVQSELLEKNRSSDLQVYAIWFNMIWSDARAKWPSDALSDPRGVHFWDEQKVVGRWYEKNVTRQGPSGSDRVEWDAYFLYGPQASWGEGPPGLVSWGHPIVAARDRLRQALIDLLKDKGRSERK